MANAPAPPYPGPPAAYPMGAYVNPPLCVVQPVQQPVYYYAPQQPQTIQTVTQVVVAQPLPTESPGQMVCPRCQTTVVTNTEYKNGYMTWIICGLLGVFLIWPCCLIPFCVDACKDVKHTCPICNSVLHIYQRS